METSSLSCQQKANNVSNCRKAYAYHFSGLTKAITRTLSRECSTVNSVQYSETLRDKLKPAIRSERWGPLSEGDVLLPNYARPHTASYTVETLQKLNSKVLEHPQCSPDFDLLDYHLCGPIKQAWRGRHSIKDQQPKETVHAWLDSQPKTFYSMGIQKIVPR